jgi:hypothetical protein
MADNMPIAAEALYGPNGPASDGPNFTDARGVINDGIAKPAAETPGNALFGDRSATSQVRPSQAAGTPPAAPFNANNYSAPEGGHIDPTLLGEFSTAARELGLDQRGGERLLDMHHKAMRAELDHYAQRLAADAGQLERTLPAQDLAAAQSFVNDPQLTPPELRPWLAQWGESPPMCARNGRSDRIAILSTT